MGSFTHKVEDPMLYHGHTCPQWLERRSICIHDVYLRPRLIFRLDMRSQGGLVGVQMG